MGLLKEEETKVTWEMLDTNDLVPTLNDIEQSGATEVKFITHHPVQPSFASTYSGNQCSRDKWTIVTRTINAAPGIRPAAATEERLIMV